LEQWGEDQANAYQATFRRAIELLRDNPQLGVARDDLASGIRSHPVDRHTIYYRLKGDIVQIVRVLHARQDAAAAFSES
jgi:toxin ParE1/3/4